MLSAFWLLLFVGSIVAKDCNTKCYRNVELKLRNVTDSFKVPSDFSKLLNRYNIIENFTCTVEEITSHIEIKKSEIRKNLDDLKNERIKHQETIDTCNGAKQTYNNLIASVDRISKNFNKVNDSHGYLINRMNESKERSLKLRKELDLLKISSSVGDNYMCNTIVLDNIQKIINSGQRITESFSVLREKQFNTLKKKNTEIKTVIDIIASLDKNINKPSLHVNNQTKPFLTEINKKIKDLQNTLKNAMFPQQEISKIFSKIYDRFENILIKHFRKVKEEIQRSKELIDIIKTKSELKEKFNHIRNTVSLLESQKGCRLVDALFEP